MRFLGLNLFQVGHPRVLFLRMGLDATKVSLVSDSREYTR